MLKLYRKTVSERVTCTQEARCILEPDQDAPQGTLRRVQVIVPNSPKCYLAIDADPQLVGPNRTYKLPVASPGAMITFHLQPEQWLVAAAHEGYVELSLIVEHIQET